MSPEHHEHHGRPDASTAAGELVPGADVQAAEPAADPAGRSGWAAVWSAVTAGIATAAGLAPHVLHHIGLFAGAFLVTGVAGNLLFGVLGLVLSIPLLRRLYRRFGTWKAPAVAVVVFSVMFSISAFVIGPAISDSDEPPAPAPSQDVSPSGHLEHHS
jgi:hypothetical protein